MRTESKTESAGDIEGAWRDGREARKDLSVRISSVGPAQRHKFI